MAMNHHRYLPFPAIELPKRRWPNNRIIKAPVWCSVDLRDGNQALEEPMDVDTKVRMFLHLVALGFKEIEVGFPASSQTEFDFVRRLIAENLIPDDVTIQVLTQAREDLVRPTFDALVGVKRAIVHLYNSTSELQRRVVFVLDKPGIIKIATDAAKLISSIASEYPETDWTFQYSPESFTGTEIDFAVDICNAVTSIWEPTPEKKVIINLPATVEMCTPNVYADMIESMCDRLRDRDSLMISLHTHNDRGTGVAATELGLLAGAERVEGTLLGNGERTGNVDIVTLALNMMSQGIDPELDFSDLTETVRVVEECTGIRVHERHPYAGMFAFTAFSGSHQDAINKGRKAMDAKNDNMWEVPYVHIDPRDIGRTLQSLVRVNSQSGKGGVAYIMRHDYGLDLPRELLINFSSVIQRIAVESGSEVTAKELFAHFHNEYLGREVPLKLGEHYELPTKDGRKICATVLVNGKEVELIGTGNGSLDAFVNGLNSRFGLDISVIDLTEHAISSGSNAQAIAYVPVRVPGHEPVWGAGIDTDVGTASLYACVSAINRAGIVFPD